MSRVPYPALLEFCSRVLRACGMAEKPTATAAKHIVGADLRGIATHGLTRLPLYADRLQKGHIAPRAQPAVVHEALATATVDAYGGMGHVAADAAMTRAVDKAEDFGIGMVTVRNSNHFGAVGEYARIACNGGLIGLAATNTPPLMAPAGGAERRLGNNPLSIAVPSSRGYPIVLDIAFSKVAAWNLVLAAQRGEPIPDDWALDKDGKPTTDAHAGFQGGGMLRAIGEHKGTGMALMMDVLSGVLSAGLSGTGPSSLLKEQPMGVAHFMMAINPEAFLPRPEFEQRLNAFLDSIESCPRARGDQPVYLPGQLEAIQEQENREQGISLTTPLIDDLIDLATQLQIEHPFVLQGK